MSASTIATVSELRAGLWNSGFRPVPIFNYDAKVTSPGKQPLGDKWQIDARRDPPFCATVPAVQHALNTGILSDGLRPIDLDIDDPEIARRCRALAASMLGEAPIRTREGSSRVLVLYAAAKGQPAKRTLTGRAHTKEHGCKIEVLGKGQQFAAFGRHHSGSDLEWFPDAPGQEQRDALPAVTEDQIQAFLEACAPVLDAPMPIWTNGYDQDHAPGEPQADPLRIAAALASIANHGAPDWEHWNRVGMAVWRATGGSNAGWEAFNAWSARNPSYSPEATRARWEHYTTSPPTSIGAGSIFHLAREATRWQEGPPPGADADYNQAEVDPPPGPEYGCGGQDGEPQSKADGTAAPPRGTAYGRLVVLGMDDIDSAAPRSYLLKGLLSPAEISLWVGAPKCGKSFLLLYVAYLLSLGQSVFGRRVKQTRVLYVAAEGEAGIANRIRALRAKFGPSENFHFIAQPADLLHDGGHKLELIDAATACSAQLIVLDTLSRLMAGGDENSPQDMGGFVRNVADVRHQTGAHVAIVHHGTKASGGTNPRGHSSLTGADDALIEVAKLDDGSRLATVIHAKDDADGGRWSFILDAVELGVDEDDDLITTLLVREQPAVEPASTTKLSPNETIALRCLDQSMKAGGILATVFDDHTEGLVVRVEDWRGWFYREGKPGEAQDTKKKAFQRAIEGLQVKRLIGTRDGFVWPIGRPR